MTRIAFLVSCVSFLVFAGGGCDSQPASSAPATPPTHPAMEAPAAKAGASSGASPARPSLPPDHPPIDPSIDAMPAEAAGAPSHLAEAGAAAGGLAEKLAQAGIAVTLPAGWVEEAPTSAMRLATIRLPRTQGDAEDGEISVSLAGGGLEANVGRWVGQFAEKPKPTQSQKTVSGFQVTMVELEGTFSGGGPMMKSGAPKSGTKLVGAIVQSPGAQQLVFFKGWGPKATMEKWRPSFDDLVASLRAAK